MMDYVLYVLTFLAGGVVGFGVAIWLTFPMMPDPSYREKQRRNS